MKKMLNELGEFGLIERLTGGFGKNFSNGLLGPGDDCAVMPVPGHESLWQLVSTDAFVEGCHFRLDFSSGYDVGWKAAAASLSDIAAMGGAPSAALISLQVRPDLSVDVLDEIYRGFRELSGEFGASVIGGDTTRASELSLAITVLGLTSKPPVLRSGARVGDDIWVSGTIGGAGAGLELLKRHLSDEGLGASRETLLLAHRRPCPRIELGKQLVEEGLVTSMIDISDGLVQDMAHIASQSRVNCVLELSAVPLAEGLPRAGFSEAAALCSGDDYELLFTAPLEAVECLEGFLQNVTRIGKVVDEVSKEGERVIVSLSDNCQMPASVFLKEQGWSAGKGYQHFRTVEKFG